MIGVGAGIFLLKERKLGTLLLIEIECGPKGCKKTNIIIVEPCQK